MLQPRTAQIDLVGLGKQPQLGPVPHSSWHAFKTAWHVPAKPESSAHQECFALGTDLLSSFTMGRIPMPQMSLLRGSPWEIPLRLNMISAVSLPFCIMSVAWWRQQLNVNRAPEGQRWRALHGICLRINLSNALRASTRRNPQSSSCSRSSHSMSMSCIPPSIPASRPAYS